MEVDETRNLETQHFNSENAEQVSGQENFDASQSEHAEVGSPDFSRTPTELQNDPEANVPQVENLNIVTLSPIETGAPAEHISENGIPNSVVKERVNELINSHADTELLDNAQENYESILGLQDQ